MSEREVRLRDFLNKQIDLKNSELEDDADSISVRVLKGSSAQTDGYESIVDFILKSSENNKKYKFKRTDSKEDFYVKKIEDNQNYFNLSEIKNLYNKLNPENKLQDLYKDLSNNIFIILEAKRNIEDIKIKMLNLYKERYPNLSEEDIKKTLLTWY